MLARLTLSGSVEVGELADALGVSPSTVRRDLKLMNDRGLLTRVHGGAGSTASPGGLRGDVETLDHRIGRTAAELVPDGATVLLTGNGPVSAMVPFLHSRRQLTVLTNGLTLAASLAALPDVSVVLLGGVLSPCRSELLGSHVARDLAEYAVDAVFASVYGLDPELGVHGSSVASADVERTLLRAGPLTVVAGVATLERRGPSRLAAVQDVHRLVCHSSANPFTVQALRARGVQIIAADDGETAGDEPGRREVGA